MQRFDAVFAHTLLQHLKEPGRALAEMRRVLKPGGVVVVADDDHSTVIWEPRTPGLTEAHHHRLLLEAGLVRVTATGTLGTGGVWGSPEETPLLRRGSRINCTRLQADNS